MSLFRDVGGGAGGSTSGLLAKYGLGAGVVAGGVALAAGGDEDAQPPSSAPPPPGGAQAQPPAQPAGGGPTSSNYSDLANRPVPGGGGAAGMDTIIGGFFPTDDTGQLLPQGPLDPISGGFVGPYAGQGIADAYHEGDEFRILKSLTTEDLVTLQEQLVSLGLASNVAFGQIDGGKSSGTVGAFRALLSMSNRAGRHWSSTLTALAESPEMQEALRDGRVQEFQEQPYLAPDYAKLRQTVMQQFRDQLGRDPEESELAEFTAEIAGWDKQNFEIQQEARRAAHEGEGAGFSAEAVDPMARFTQQFEKVYSGELDFLEDKEEARFTQGFTDAATDTLSTMSRGEF